MAYDLEAFVIHNIGAEPPKLDILYSHFLISDTKKTSQFSLMTALSSNLTELLFIFVNFKTEGTVLSDSKLS